MIGKNLSFLIFQHTSNSIPVVCCRSPVSFSRSLNFFSTSVTSPSLFDILRHKYDFPPESASRVASELTHLKNPEKADSMLSFLKESGFSNTQLVRIAIYRPRLLAASLEGSIKPKIKILRDVGFSSDDISKTISTSPTILLLSVNNNIVPSLSVLKGLLGSDNEVARVVRKCSRLLTGNLENNVVPNVEFLKGCGVPMERIRIILSGSPSAFLIKPEVMRKSADKAEEMGINSSSKSYIYAISTIARLSNEVWEIKLQAFRDLGFSDSDISIMFRKVPQVLRGSTEKIKKIKGLLLATGKFSMSSIVDYPKSLASSVENRYIPRLQILGILESRNLIENWPSLAAVSMLPDVKFFEKFVSPYWNEVSDVWITKGSAMSQMGMKP